jgi:putative oxidoreductase
LYERVSLFASSPREVDGPAEATKGVKMTATRSRGSRINESAPLIVRLAQGSLMAGHGAQKLFGSFGGPGLDGTSGFMEMLGMRPGRPWAYLAGLSEFGGGLLTALGLLNPLGPLGIIGSMSMATRKAHWGKPVWVTEGGAELPLLNIAVSTALMIREPDRYSLDRILGIRLPAWVGPLGLVGVILTVLYTEIEADEAPAEQQEEAPPQEEGAQDAAREELAGP